MKIKKEILEKAELMDCDYFTCSVCKEDMVNVVAGHFPCCWCNNGCEGHGDIFITPGRKLPRKVKKILLKQIEEDE